MRENLVRIFILWGVQLFLVLLLLGGLVNNTLPTHIKVILFCGLLAIFESIGFQKYSMYYEKNNTCNN